MKFKILGLAVVLVASLSSAKAQNIVLNPGFENGVAVPPYTGNFSAPNWTPTPATSGSFFEVSDADPHSGSNAVDFGGSSGEFDYISQALSTVVGTTYDVSFFLSVSNIEPEGTEQTPSNEFVANIGGTLGTSPTLFGPTGTDETEGGAANYISGGTTLADVVNAADSPYVGYTAEFVASDTTTNIIFGGLNGPNFDYLDDISVVAQSNVSVPEPSQYGLLVLTAMGLLVWRRMNGPVRVKARI